MIVSQCRFKTPLLFKTTYTPEQMQGLTQKCCPKVLSVAFNKWSLPVLLKLNICHTDPRKRGPHLILLHKVVFIFHWLWMTFFFFFCVEFKSSQTIHLEHFSKNRKFQNGCRGREKNNVMMYILQTIPLSLCARASRHLLRRMTFKVFQRESYNFELLRCYVCTIQF